MAWHVPVLCWAHRSGEDLAMHEVALLLKSYAGDVEYARRLITTFHAHNPSRLHMFCLVPPDDLPLFAPESCSTITVMSEDVLAAHLVSEDVAGLRPAYINQEIVKLAFHELGLAHNYFCIDSDAQIIRDITAEDFIAPDGNPYTVLVEDNDLKVDPIYFEQYWRSREQQLERIAELVGWRGLAIRTCHGHQVFSSTVLRTFVNDFLTPRGWDYRDALAIAPYEFTWYNLWAQVCQVIPVHQREPLIKVFHHEGQLQEAILRGITEDDLARGYLGVVINSNWARELAEAPSGGSKPARLAPHLSYGETAALIAAKLRQTARRRLSFGH